MFNLSIEGEEWINYLLLFIPHPSVLKTLPFSRVKMLLRLLQFHLHPFALDECAYDLK
jgi:hypothetical protein